jgi:hypothetical protein
MIVYSMDNNSIVSEALNIIKLDIFPYVPLEGRIPIVTAYHYIFVTCYKGKLLSNYQLVFGKKIFLLFK